ncbi:site-specific DNA-methyltransferase [Ferrovum sp. PN-J185]|uniref:site-specific DNA-methyltransferase n=1 Tax=Ferrovum sp. PN-J185 TaxID=1356306 RepID=UPI000794B27D|nr:site-specific DNA-methyltransferase [Ferrovum sp. PN-J185]KXW56623.1 putative methyltransferase [Ferrovum sp. PN-J185]
MEKMKMHSANITDLNIESIFRLFPSCVVEAFDKNGNLSKKIDFDLLKQELSAAVVDGITERYQINWPGKRAALLTANSPIAKTLRPSREESIGFDSTKNIFIEGDNLDVLKMLQETYLGKVKMIYIDPPYNTGNDFVYKDNFTEDLELYFERSNQVDADGGRLVSNTESNGRFHSDWLNMIYPRLKLARNLLRDDGVICISIDDNEQANLKKLCDEIFGESNLVGVVAKKSKLTSNSGEFFSPSHEYILVYAKSKEDLNGFSDQESQEDEDYIKLFKHEDSYSKYNIVGLYQPSLTLERSRNARYFITCPDGSKCIPPENKRWRVIEPSFHEMVSKDLVVFKETKTSPLIDEDGKQSKWNIYTKIYLKDRLVSGMRPVTFLDRYPNSEASKDLIKLDIPFDFSKPKNLIIWLQKICGVDNDDIVLDFFAGSGTTAHAVMQLNAETNGSRRFILIQIPEPCTEKSDAAKAGYKFITDISRERIRRAGKAILESAPLIEWSKDIGFRVLKLDASNFSEIYYNPDAVSQDLLSEQEDNVRSDRTAEDLLFQVLLDWGVDLSLPISSEMIQGKSVFFVDQNALVACFDKQGGVDEDFVKELAKRQPLRVVFRDAGFKSDSVKINVEQIFKLLSPSTEVKCI